MRQKFIEQKEELLKSLKIVRDQVSKGSSKKKKSGEQDGDKMLNEYTQ